MLQLKPPFIIGVVHVGPLPGSPTYGGDLDKVIAEAVENATALVDGGVDAIIVENFYDAPFPNDKADPATVSSMTAVVMEVRRAVNVPIGINILRNCGLDAAAVAAATNASFIRVNALAEVVVTDQGILEPIAHELMRYFKILGYQPAILADVHVKHGAPLVTRPIDVVAVETVERGKADAVIVTGKATGAEPNLEDVIQVKNAVNAPVIVGSGVNLTNISKLLKYADGAIVGTYFKEGRRVVTRKVRELVEAVHELRP